MDYEVVGLLILLVVVLVATLANLYGKVERLEQRLQRFGMIPRASDDAISSGDPAFR
jgi:LST-1 protein